jgi:hypothetical protein
MVLRMATVPFSRVESWTSGFVVLHCGGSWWFAAQTWRIPIGRIRPVLKDVVGFVEARREESCKSSQLVGIDMRAALSSRIECGSLAALWRIDKGRGGAVRGVIASLAKYRRS